MRERLAMTYILVYFCQQSWWKEQKWLRDFMLQQPGYGSQAHCFLWEQKSIKWLKIIYLDILYILDQRKIQSWFFFFFNLANQTNAACTLK